MSSDTPLTDEETAIALREAGLPMGEGSSEIEAYRSYLFQAQSAMRKQARANEIALKGLYVDWAFSKLNLTHLR